MKVYIPGPLRSYTSNVSEVDGDGGTLDALLANLDRRYPGMRFRIIDEQDGIRRHIKLFVNQEQARALTARLSPDDVVHIICGISGGR